MHLCSIIFIPTGSNSSLFVYRCGDALAYLLVYVDDIIFMASTTSLLQRIIHELCREFAIRDLGMLKFFLGVQVRRDANGFFLTQARMEDILDCEGMANYKPTAMPVDTKQKLPASDGEPMVLGKVLDSRAPFAGLKLG